MSKGWGKRGGIQVVQPEVMFFHHIDGERKKDERKSTRGLSVPDKIDG